MSDEPLGCLLQLIWAPYQMWKRMSEESRVGSSEMDRQSGRFVKAFGVIATLAVLAGVLAWVWLTLK